MRKFENTKLKIMVLLVAALNLALLFMLATHRRGPRIDTESVDAIDLRQSSNSIDTGERRVRIITAPANPVYKAAETIDGRIESGEAKKNKDLIEGEYVLRFQNDSDLMKFIQHARDHGATVIDIIKGWSAVRLRVKDPEKLDYLVGLEPKPIGFSHNYYTRTPYSPGNRVPEVSLAGYSAFRNTAPTWLGLHESKDFRGEGVVVAVLDTGVVDHAALAHTTVDRLNLVEDEQSAAEQSNGHGTAVASIIAGGSPGAPGIAPDSEILSIQVMNDDGLGDAFTLARGIWEAVDQGADIIVMSLGTHGDTFILKAAVDYALANDVAVVAAAGNDGFDEVTFPARYEGVVGVSAVDAAGQHAAFSNTGSDVDIAAPGIGINAAWTDGQVVSFSGTSSAAPFVAGTLAGIMSSSPEANAAEAVETLLNYTHDTGAPGWDPEFGSGILSVGWIQDRKQSGIHDIALTGHYLDPTTAQGEVIAIVVSAQNQGTEPLSKINLKVAYDDGEEDLEFYNVGVGETVSKIFHVSAARLQELSRMNISSEVSISGMDDTNVKNNTKNSIIIYDEGNAGDSQK